MNTGKGKLAENDATKYRLRVLGPFELADEATETKVTISSKRMRALLAYLVASQNGAETRQRLAELLWTKKDYDLARQSLRQLLSQLRRGSGAGVATLLQDDGASLHLNMSRLAVDRNLLLGVPHDADIDALMRAADAYREEFATGLDLGEAEFDDWLLAERSRCRDTAIRLIDRLVQTLMETDRSQEALDYANRLARIDPLREKTHRLVIACEAAVSGRASAMMRYEGFRQILRDELGVTPERATLQLLDDLRLRHGRDRSSYGHESRSAASNGLPLDQTVIIAESVLPKRRWAPSASLMGVLALIMLGSAAAIWLTQSSAAPDLANRGKSYDQESDPPPGSIDCGQVVTVRSSARCEGKPAIIVGGCNMRDDGNPRGPLRQIRCE